MFKQYLKNSLTLFALLIIVGCAKEKQHSPTEVITKELFEARYRPFGLKETANGLNSGSSNTAEKLNFATFAEADAFMSKQLSSLSTSNTNSTSVFIPYIDILSGGIVESNIFSYYEQSFKIIAQSNYWSSRGFPNIYNVTGVISAPIPGAGGSGTYFKFNNLNHLVVISGGNGGSYAYYPQQTYLRGEFYNPYGTDQVALIGLGTYTESIGVGGVYTYNQVYNLRLQATLVVSFVSQGGGATGFSCNYFSVQYTQ